MSHILKAGHELIVLNDTEHRLDQNPFSNHSNNLTSE